MSDVRNYVSDQAARIAGLGYRESTRAAYLDLIAPDGVEHDPALEQSMGHMWSCALTTLGLWRRLGVEHPLLLAKYVIGKAMVWVSQVGEDKGAERHPDGHAMPELGDAIEVNGGFHVIAAITATRAGVNDALLVDTVEGGQSDAGGMCIKAFSNKPLRYENGVLLIGEAKVFRWYDCTALGISTVPGTEVVEQPDIPVDIGLEVEGDIVNGDEPPEAA